MYLCNLAQKVKSRFKLSCWKFQSEIVTYIWAGWITRLWRNNIEVCNLE